MAVEVLSVDKNERVQRYDPISRRYTPPYREIYAKPRVYLSLDMGNDGRAGES